MANQAYLDEDFVYRFAPNEGKYVDDINWVKKGHVPPDVGSQGNCSVCWAYATTRCAEAAFSCHGKPVPTLSAQYVIDHTYPKRPRCRGGHVPCALELIRDKGIPKEEDYKKYTGLKNSNTNLIISEDQLFKIEGWKLIKDTEQDMAVNLAKQPLVANIPIFHFTGDGLVDVVAALEDMESRTDSGDSVEYHTIMVVGQGKFVLKNKFKGLKQIDYWYIKNQWNNNWGTNGFAYLIKTSSLIKMKSADKGRNLTKEEVDEITLEYVPLTPVMDISDLPKIKIEEITNIKKMQDYVTLNQYKDHDLLFLFVGEHCREEKKKKCKKVFEQLSLIYEYDQKMIFAYLDLNDLDVATRRVTKRQFDLGRSEWVIMAYKKTDLSRNLRDGEKYKEKYKGDDHLFGELVTWLGEEMSMGVCPSQDSC